MDKILVYNPKEYRAFILLKKYQHQTFFIKKYQYPDFLFHVMIF